LAPILADLVPAARREGIAQTLIALAYGLWLRHAYDPWHFDLDVIRAIARDYVDDVVAPA
ncbi:MAG: TetR family transcriptional regulator C-terminal domain-containing protein, partial [Proteobacteria bacterium]|nr:TetR family transcriptional regulator C-terminal domain-containing protein [Pseudomonadota bacterium]